MVTFAEDWNSSRTFVNFNYCKKYNMRDPIEKTIDQSASTPQILLKFAKMREGGWVRILFETCILVVLGRFQLFLSASLRNTKCAIVLRRSLIVLVPGQL